MGGNGLFVLRVENPAGVYHTVIFGTEADRTNRRRPLSYGVAAVIAMADDRAKRHAPPDVPIVNWEWGAWDDVWKLAQKA